MKNVTIMVVAILSCISLLGCSTSNMELSEITKPELLEQYPLPPIPLSVNETQLILDLNLYIMKDGSVRNVIIKNNIPNKDWVVLAKKSILKWRYSPARINNKPLNIWINQKTIVQILEPIYYILAEIKLDSLTTAKHVYKMLQENENFGKLARTYSVDSSGKTNGLIGKVNIMRYSHNIRKELLKMNYNEFTKPLKYGDKYLIFMRLKDY